MILLHLKNRFQRRSHAYPDLQPGLICNLGSLLLPIAHPIFAVKDRWRRSNADYSSVVPKLNVEERSARARDADRGIGESQRNRNTVCEIRIRSNRVDHEKIRPTHRALLGYTIRAANFGQGWNAHQRRKSLPVALTGTLNRPELEWPKGRAAKTAERIDLCKHVLRILQ